jgi:hypothetical protein
VGDEAEPKASEAALEDDEVGLEGDVTVAPELEEAPEAALEGVEVVPELGLEGTTVADPSVAAGGGHHVGSLGDEAESPPVHVQMEKSAHQSKHART